MMTNWLPETPSTLPLYAHTMIGVGGLVIDSQDRILLMRERRGVYLGWKYPGGLSEPGESIFDTAEREVFEETGVKALGKAILCFRQIAGSQYENVGDIYFICVMEAVDDTMNVGCTEEAAECKWFTREEIMSLPEKVFRDFHHEILSRYDKWKSSGRAGCYMASCKFTGRGACKMFYVD
ncbi:hydrolase, NUDIX family [Ostertagia ostertagi]